MSSNGVYQKRYWREMDQLKVHSLYLGEYLQSTTKIDRGINIFLAITSSSSICGWAIFKEYAFVWGSLIAVSQLINAIKTYLPYSNRLKSLRGITNEIDALCIAMETKWFDVSEGKLESVDIHSIQMTIKNKKREIEHKYLTVNPLPKNDKFLNKAKSMAITYFTNLYGED